jgi:hypothetical protein
VRDLLFGAGPGVGVQSSGGGAVEDLDDGFGVGDGDASFGEHRRGRRQQRGQRLPIEADLRADLLGQPHPTPSRTTVPPQGVGDGVLRLGVAVVEKHTGADHPPDVQLGGGFGPVVDLPVVA